MVSRKKAIEKLLKSITFERTTALSNNKGPIVRDPHSPGISRKAKKHSGRVTPRWNKNGGMKYREAVQEALEPQVFYDDWKDWRDGQRRWYVDASRFKKGMNRKKYNQYTKEWQTPEHINKKLMKELMIRREMKKYKHSR